MGFRLQMRGATAVALTLATETGAVVATDVVVVVGTVVATVGGLTNVTLQAFGEFLSASNGDVVANAAD